MPRVPLGRPPSFVEDLVRHGFAHLQRLVDERVVAGRSADVDRSRGGHEGGAGPDVGELLGEVAAGVLVRLAASPTCDDAADDVSIDVAAGDVVALSAHAELPSDTGEIVGVEWDFEGTGTYSDSPRSDETGPDLGICETHTYDEPGTYFPVVRVTAQRDGDPDATHGLRSRTSPGCESWSPETQRLVVEGVDYLTPSGPSPGGGGRRDRRR